MSDQKWQVVMRIYKVPVHRGTSLLRLAALRDEKSELRRSEAGTPGPLEAEIATHYMKLATNTKTGNIVQNNTTYKQTGTGPFLKPRQTVTPVLPFAPTFNFAAAGSCCGNYSRFEVLSE